MLRDLGEGLFSPSPTFCHTSEKHVPDTVLDGPPPPSNVLTRIPQASREIHSQPVLASECWMLICSTLCGLSPSPAFLFRVRHACSRLPSVTPAEGSHSSWKRLAPQAQ